jgi:hypothetical protein
VQNVFIQHEQTQKFLDQNDEWTPDAGQARNFPTSLNAIAHCMANHLRHARLVVRIEGAQDIVLPIKEENGTGTKAPQGER